MSFSSISSRFSPAAFAFLPKQTVRLIAFEKSKLYPLMLDAFEDRFKMHPLMDSWKASSSETWDGQSTTLHKIAEYMPLGSDPFSAFKSLTGGYEEDNQHHLDRSKIHNEIRPLLYQCSPQKDDKGNTPLYIAIQRKNWPLVEYLQRFDAASGYDTAMVFLKNIEFMPLSPQDKAEQGNKGSLDIVNQYIRGVNLTRDIVHQHGASDSFARQFRLTNNFIRMFVSSKDWEKQDEHGWTLAHWLAFKGIPKIYVEKTVQFHWDSDEDSLGNTPDQIAELIAYIADERSPEKPQMKFQKLDLLPETRANELVEVLNKRNQAFIEKIRRGSLFLPAKACSDHL